MEAPTGTITFLFTDIEGSSRLWERFPVDMGPALARHDALLRAMIGAAGGFVFKTVGDAFCAAFASPATALEAAIAAQRALFAENWGATGPLRVRMGLHTGPAEFRGQDYFGGTLNRVARICASGHGGQMLVSETLAGMLESAGEGVSFESLGEFRLRNLNRVEKLFQVNVEGLPRAFPPLRTQQNLPHNLPVPVTSFVGREAEMEQVKQLVGSHRILTLLGTGGTGKTRLALEAGGELLESYADGVWLVELAALDGDASVADAIASALGVREEPGRTMRESLLSFLGKRELLLILDNCEHIQGTVASEAASLLAGCAKLHILATSRQALRIPGEVTLPVLPLSAFNLWGRAGERKPRAEDIASFDAVRLFIERARAVQPSFELNDANAPDIARICWRLDGIPLAIELAAARLRVLLPGQIAERLSDRFKLLKGVGQAALPHQQTLRALIDWSYDLLDQKERILFHRLGVFVGGRSLEAVEAVCSGGEVGTDDILDLLQQLADKSLIFIDGADGARPRFTLIESVWHYAREKLGESGEMDAMRDRHLDYFLGIVEEAEPQLAGPEPAGWVRRLATDSLNLRFALEHAADRKGGGETALRLVAGLERFWEICGNLEEAGRHAEAVLARADAAEHPEWQARALTCAGRIAWAHDRYEDGLRYFKRAREILEARRDPMLLGTLNASEGFLAFSVGDIDGAKHCFEQTAEIGSATGDRRLIAMVEAARGSIAAHEGRIEEAFELKSRALGMFRELGDKWIVGYSLWGLAQVALALGRPAPAREALREWAQIAREVGNRWSAPYLLQLLADTARLDGKPELAARLFGAAEQQRETLGVRFAPHEQKQYEASILALRDSLSPEDLSTHWTAGRHLRLGAAMDLALAG
jgi:predicted ATPase/class 3 adenylate cyclase